MTTCRYMSPKEVSRDIEICILYTEIHIYIYIKDLEIGKPIEPTRILCCFCQLHTLNLETGLRPDKINRRGVEAKPLR